MPTEIWSVNANLVAQSIATKVKAMADDSLVNNTQAIEGMLKGMKDERSALHENLAELRRHCHQLEALAEKLLEWSITDSDFHEGTIGFLAEEVVPLAAASLGVEGLRLENKEELRAAILAARAKANPL